MTAPRRIQIDSVPPQPWRNGGGVTRELLTWPAGDGWQLRISLADIDAEGPFSAFPGVERWFVVLAGAGVELTVGGTPYRLRPGDAPLRFDGAAATGCRLIGGPTRDLNLMLRNAQGAMQVAHDAKAWQPGADRCGLFTTLAGVCLHDDDATPLRAGTLLWFDDAPASLRFEASAPPSTVVGVPVGWWLAATPMKGPA